ncbi:MAG: aryl-sulfate sulfohydrolase, partial [Limisphaerales bacterium]
FPAYLQSYGGSYVMEQQDPLFRSRPVGVIREGDWKLMEWFETGELELYHLKEDVGESTNLSHQCPAMTRRLHESMQAW